MGNKESSKRADFNSPLSNIVPGVPLWHSGLRIWCCHCSSLGHCCGAGSIPGPGTSICYGCGQKKKNHSISMGLGSKVYLLFVCLLFFPHMQHMEVPGLGVELELQLLAYATATATQYPSHVCDLHHSTWHCWILNPWSEARDQTCILMDTGWVCCHQATTGTLKVYLL